MTLELLEDALHQAFDKTGAMSFSELIRDCRNALGMKQYRAAEFVGIGTMRMKNLETGYFRDMPTIDEVRNLSALYDLEIDELYERAKKQVAERSLTRKIKRMMGDESTVQPMPA